MIVIMGPGRCGTTVVIRILQAMGYDTGDCHEIFREKPAEIREPGFKWPHVVKGTGTLCHNLNNWAKRWDVDIVIMCSRELEANIQSMMKKKRGQGIYKYLTPEEFEEAIRTEVPDSYRRAKEQIKHGGYQCVEISFPRSAKDIDYCYRTLKEAIPDLDRDRFNAAWHEVVEDRLIRFGG